MIDQSRSKRAQFHLPSFVLWIGLVLPLALGIAAASMHVQQLGYAPLGILSILVGLLLGTAAAGAAGVANMGHRASGLTAAVAVALLTAATQHLIAYRQYRAAFQVSERSAVRLALLRTSPPAFGPTGLGPFLRAAARQRAAGLWLLDAALITAACLAVVFIRLRQPFCNCCRSWYHPVQSGPLDSHTAARLGTSFGIELPEGAEAVTYCLLACRSGCGRSGLQLSWLAAPGRVRSPRVWLSAEQRDMAGPLLTRRQQTDP